MHRTEAANAAPFPADLHLPPTPVVPADAMRDGANGHCSLRLKSVMKTLTASSFIRGGAALLLAGVALVGVHQAGSRVVSHPARDIRTPLSRLPLSFEVNRGQANSSVRFLSRGSGYTFFVKPTEALIALAPVRGKGLGLADKTPASVVRMKLLGANTAAKVAGVGKPQGISNYLIGRNPKNWRTDISNFTRVRCEDVYAGVDLIYYGNQNELEHDFVVSPGADASAIQLQYAGVTGTALAEDGNLLLHTRGGTVQQRKPIAYQQVAGRRTDVPAAYDVREDNVVTFRLGAYDHTQPLVIDPVLVYSTFIGGSAEEFAMDVKVDAARNVYLTGYTGSFAQAQDDRPTQVPTTEGGPYPRIPALAAFPLQAPIMGDPDSGADNIDLSSPRNGTIDATFVYSRYDAFITKLDPTGKQLMYSTYLGAEGDDYGLGIAVDSNQSIYVTGMTGSFFWPLVNALQTDQIGVTQGFVAKLTPAGDDFVYSTYIGGSANNRGRAIAVDASGNAYVAGLTSSTDFPTFSFFGTPAQRNYGGGRNDAFLLSLNPTGTAFNFSTYIGGRGAEDGISAGVGSLFTLAVDGSPMDHPTQGVISSPLSDLGIGLALDSDGNAFVAGGTDSTDFPTTDGILYGKVPALQSGLGGGTDAFIAAFNFVGEPLYGTFLGGSGDEAARAIALDAQFNMCVAGYTTSDDFPTQPAVVFGDAFQGSRAGGIDAFASKISADGLSLDFSSYLGGLGTDVANGMAVSPIGHMYVSGTSTSNTSFPVKNQLQAARLFGFDAFVTKYVPDGSQYEYSTLIGGFGSNFTNATDWSTSIAVSGDGEAYLTGFTGSEDYPVTRGALDTSSNFVYPDFWAFYPLGDVFFTRLASPPSEPRTLVATAISRTEIRLNWTDYSDNEVDFLLERSVNNGQTFSPLATLPANTVTFTDTGLTAQTTYKYRLRARNSLGISAYSNIATATTKPAPPPAASNLTVALYAGRPNVVQLNWSDNSTTESGFKILYSTDGFATAGKLVREVPPNTRTAIHDTVVIPPSTRVPLARNTTYSYQIVAFSRSAGVDNDSPPSNTAGCLTLPADPTGLSVSAVSSSELRLTWTDNNPASSGTSQFNVFRGTVATGPFIQVATTPAAPAGGTATFTDSGLQPSTSYYYRVRGFNTPAAGVTGGGNSPFYSNIAGAMTLPAGLPNAPTGLTATVISHSQIDLRWEDNSNNETSFRIERRKGNLAYVTAGSVGANVRTFSDTGLEPQTSYTYRVFAVSSGVDSAPSREAGGTTLRLPPAAPSNLRVTGKTATNVLLAWNDNSNNETAFKIERSTDGGSTFPVTKSVAANVTTLTDIGLASNTTYHYRVRATNSGSNSAASNTVSALTLPSAPSSLVARTLSRTQISLTWKDNSAQSSRIKIEKSNNGGATWTHIVTVGPNVTSYTNAFLTPGATYHYRVRATNASGDSAYSNVASATTLP